MPCFIEIELEVECKEALLIDYTYQKALHKIATDLGPVIDIEKTDFKNLLLSRVVKSFEDKSSRLSIKPTQLYVYENYQRAIFEKPGQVYIVRIIYVNLFQGLNFKDQKKGESRKCLNIK